MIGERMCGCGHVWAEHEPITQIQNDAPVVVGRRECRGEAAQNTGTWRYGRWMCRCPQPFDPPKGYR